MRHPVDPLFQIISQIMSLVAHGFGRVVYFRNRIKELAYFLFQMTLMFAQERLMKRTQDYSSFLVGSWILETNHRNIVGLNARDKDLQQRILKFHLLELPMLHFAFAELIMKTRLKVNEYVHDIKNRIPEFKVMHKSQRTFKKPF